MEMLGDGDAANAQLSSSGQVMLPFAEASKLQNVWR